MMKFFSFGNEYSANRALRIAAGASREAKSESIELCPVTTSLFAGTPRAIAVEHPLAVRPSQSNRQPSLVTIVKWQRT